jgi:NRPS condensation-like uncharacterized protein
MPSAELPDVGLFGARGRYGDLCTHAIVDLGRAFSRDELERALAETLRDFPVLGHRYQPGLWRDRWVPVEGPISDAVYFEVSEDIEPETANWVRRSLDSTRDRQIRVVALKRGDRLRLVLTLSHLAVDGAGIAAVGHVLGARLYGVPPALPVEQRRDIWRALEGLRWYHLPVLGKAFAGEALRPLRHLAARRRERPYRRDAASVATWRHVVVTGAELERIRRRCGGATVNDVLIAALARVAATQTSRGPVVVTYTMDLRRYGTAPRLTAANTSSILSVLVARDALGDLPSAVAAVAAQSARQQRGLAGPGFMLVPYALGAGMPHAAVRAMTKVFGPLMVDVPISRGLLITNVGRVDEGLRAFGDDIEALRIVGPNILGVPIPVVVAFGFRGELCLELFAAPGIGEHAVEEMEREILTALELDRE